MHSGGARIRAALAAAVLVAALGAPAGAATPSGAVADPSLDGVIHADQLALVLESQTQTVNQAAAALATARGSLDEQTAVANQDENLSVDADKALVTDVKETGQARAAFSAAAAAHTADAARSGHDALALQRIGISWYMGGPVQAPGTSTLPTTPAEQEATSELQALTKSVTQSLEHDDLATAAAAASLAKAAAAFGAASGRQSAAARLASARARAAAVATGQVSADKDVVASGQATLVQATLARNAAVAAFEGPEGSSDDPVPTIVGASALDAAQLVAWYQAQGYEDATPAPIGELASLYIDEGEALGVRGDIAFAQAIVETAGFISPEAANNNDYAGIGFCDSCSHGIHFPTPKAGVTGQLELLRTYADGGFRGPAVVAALDPANEFNRGCCPTWNALTGHWATSPTYGTEILDVYASMLAFSVSVQRQASA